MVPQSPTAFPKSPYHAGDTEWSAKSGDSSGGVWRSQVYATQCKSCVRLQEPQQTSTAGRGSAIVTDPKRLMLVWLACAMMPSQSFTPFVEMMSLLDWTTTNSFCRSGSHGEL